MEKTILCKKEKELGAIAVEIKNIKHTLVEIKEES